MTELLGKIQMRWNKAETGVVGGPGPGPGMPVGVLRWVLACLSPLTENGNEWDGVGMMIQRTMLKRGETMKRPMADGLDLLSGRINKYPGVIQRVNEQTEP